MKSGRLRRDLDISDDHGIRRTWRESDLLREERDDC